MSDDEFDLARDEYESDIANKTLEEHALQYVLEAQPEDVQDAVTQWQAEEWLQQSSDWLQLINIVSQADRQQLRDTIRYRTAYGAVAEQSAASKELHLFNLASDISKLLETSSSWYQYLSRCNVSEDLSWVDNLVQVTRAFRDILFSIADKERSPYLQWELVSQLGTINEMLEKGTLSNLFYKGFGGKHHKFTRNPNPTTTPLASLLADWMCNYLVTYSNQIDLGACSECGKIFSRQRRDNAYCSKTCQNRVAYKRKKIFESGLLQKIDFHEKTAAEHLQPGVWVYHPRLGLGFVAKVQQGRRGLSVTARFPQIVRTFHRNDLFQAHPETPKIEFYRETDAVALAELL